MWTLWFQTGQVIIRKEQLYQDRIGTGPGPQTARPQLCSVWTEKQASDEIQSGGDTRVTETM